MVKALASVQVRQALNYATNRKVLGCNFGRC
jgi:ABC-type transport system substrate-binding protein